MQVFLFYAGNLQNGIDKFIKLLYTKCNSFVINLRNFERTEEAFMITSKLIRQICLTTVCAMIGTTTVFAADMGQATGNNVNVRTAAGTDAEVLGKIQTGSNYTVTGKSGSWYQIDYNGQIGFVSGDYFQLTETEGTVTGTDVNIRSDATTSSNVIGSVNTGDTLTAVGRSDGWYQVQYQGREGYISEDYLFGDYLSSLTVVGTANPEITQASADVQYAMVTANSGLKLRKEASLNSIVLTVLPYGTVLDVDRVGPEWVRVITDDGQKGYVSAEYVSVRSGEKPSRSSSSASAKGAEIVAYAKQFIGTPYVWGGTDLNNGVDCSGFVYAVLRDFGISVNRSSSSMASNGIEVAKSELQAGDLVFFNSGGNSAISHVGIYMGDGNYIHSTDGAASGVTVTSLNSGYSANTYVTARRVIR